MGQLARITKQTEPAFRQKLQSTSRAPNSSLNRASAKDAKLRDIILAEVLDTRQSIQWTDIAGLENAKQVSDQRSCWH